MKTAQIILKQLGGNKFVSMTGAKNLAGGTDYLSFGIMKNRGKITHVKIRLNSFDLYNCTFYSIRGTEIKAQDIADNVPVENLRSVFTDKTGLDTSL